MATSLPSRFALRARAVATAVHLLASLLVAVLAAMLVFLLWYPDSFRWLAGGQTLFLLVVSVDVVAGPLLTFAVFDPTKRRAELGRDLFVIAVLQLGALGYGLHTVYIARPVAMVYEVDRFRLVTANDVSSADLQKADPAYRSLPLTGPLLLGTRRPSVGAERNDALAQGLAGHDVGMRPQFWQPYESSRSTALARSRPASLLFDHYPSAAPDLRQRVVSLRGDPSTCRFVPVIARGAWAAVLDGEGNLLGYLPVDGFI